jgi:hypothetical protein
MELPQVQDQQATMVHYETDEKVGIITLDRADKLNAINSAMKDQIIAAFARADKEPSTSVIVLRANGRSFSAGFDIGHSPDRGKDTGAADPNTWDPILHRSFDFGIAPWSASIPSSRSMPRRPRSGASSAVVSRRVASRPRSNGGARSSRNESEHVG